MLLDPLQGTTFGAPHLESPSLYPLQHKVWIEPRLELLFFEEDTTIVTPSVLLFTLECKQIQVN